MSALPPKADIRRLDCDVRFVPKADIDPYARFSGNSAAYSTLRLFSQNDAQQRAMDFEMAIVINEA